MKNEELKPSKNLTWFMSKKRQRFIVFVMILFLPLSFLVQVYPADAAAPCLASISAGVQHARPHPCCEGAAQCNCHMKETGSSKLPDPTIVSFSDLSDPLSKGMVLSQDIVLLSFSGRQASGETEELAQGPPVSIYLQTLNFLC